MRVSIREGMIRGRRSLTEMFERAAKLGFDGIECGWIADEQWPELQAAVATTGVRPALIAPGEGTALHADAGERRKWVDASRRALDRCAEIGAVGFIVVPTLPNKMRGLPRIGDLWPYQSQLEAEQSVFIEMLRLLGPHAADLGVWVVVECLNRYEQFWPLRLADGVAVCERAGCGGVGILADFFHMNIEEADIAASIAAARDWIVHVHVADSHRYRPGSGHTDFLPGFRELVAAGYDKYVGLEYTLGPDPDEDMAGGAALTREMWRQAGG